MPETSTTKLLSTIEATTTLLSTPLPKSVCLVHLILTLHKQLSASLQRLCNRVLNSVRESACRGHEVIKASNARLCEIHEDVSTIDSRLCELRGRRAGLWEGVNHSLTKLSSFSEESWGVHRIYDRVFSRGVTTPASTRADKLRTREAFRNSANELRLVDERITELDKEVAKLGMEQECLQGSVSDFRDRVTRLVRCIGFWERLSDRISDVGVGDVLPLVEMFLDVGNEVDATAIVDLPDGVCAALRRYCERWRYVVDGDYSDHQVSVGALDDALRDVEDKCDELKVLTCSCE